MMSRQTFEQFKAMLEGAGRPYRKTGGATLRPRKIPTSPTAMPKASRSGTAKARREVNRDRSGERQPT